MDERAIADVRGDAGQIRTVARKWGNEASTYNRQVTRLTGIQNSLPAGKFQGAKGDAMRLFLSDSLKTATAMRGAYQQISSAAPFVADAIDEAKEARRQTQRAKRELERAEREEAEAARDLAQAQLALVAAIAKDALTPHGHAAAAAQQAVHAAQGRHDRARTELTRAQRAFTRAQSRFTQAQQAQQRCTQAFQRLLTEQTAIIQRTATSAPPPSSVAQVNSTVHQLTVLGYGRQAIKGLLDAQLKVARSVEDVQKVLNLRTQAALVLRDGVKLKDLRVLRSLDKGGGLGPLTARQAGSLSNIEKISGPLSKANYALSGLLSVATAYEKVADNPTLSRQQKQDYVVNQFIGRFGGGVAGGVACSPSIVASAGCGYAGSELGGALAGTRAGRFATDAVSRNVVTPALTPAYDIADGKSLPKIVLDSATILPKIEKNVVTDASPVSVKFDGGLPSVGLKLPFSGH